MAKVLKCCDVGFDCSFEARGETTENVMGQVVQHAKDVHGMDTVPPEVTEKVAAAIHEE
jgi:predicted small metal-binding protein